MVCAMEKVRKAATRNESLPLRRVRPFRMAAINTAEIMMAKATAAATRDKDEASKKTVQATSVQIAVWLYWGASRCLARSAHVHGRKVQTSPTAAQAAPSWSDDETRVDNKCCWHGTLFPNWFGAPGFLIAAYASTVRGYSPCEWRKRFRLWLFRVIDRATIAFGFCEWAHGACIAYATACIVVCDRADFRVWKEGDAVHAHTHAQWEDDYRIIRNMHFAFLLLSWLCPGTFFHMQVILMRVVNLPSSQCHVHEQGNFLSISSQCVIASGLMRAVSLPSITIIGKLVLLLLSSKSQISP